MSRHLAALLFALFAVVASSACSSELPASSQLAAVAAASTPACPGSEEAGCTNGKPLCAPDNGGTCLMCRCTEYTMLQTDAPGLVVARSALGGNTPTPHVYGP